MPAVSETAPVTNPPKPATKANAKATEPAVTVNRRTGKQRVVEHVRGTEQVPDRKPGPSGVQIETSQLVRGIGAFLIGAGIIGAAIWYFGADFIQMALIVALPLLIIFVGLRFISWGTLQLIWNGELKEKVTAYMTALEATK